MISPSQRPLPDNTQHSLHTNIQALGGIRTHDRSRRAAVDLRLRPRGHWDRHLTSMFQCNSIHQALVLRPSCVPDKVSVHQKGVYQKRNIHTNLTFTVHADTHCTRLLRSRDSAQDPMDAVIMGPTVSQNFAFSLVTILRGLGL